MMRASLAKNPADVAAMFDAVARRYDLMNDLLSLGLARGWRRATSAAVAPRPGLAVLDLAAGTGAASRPLAAIGADVTAADFSDGMLAVGRRRYPELRFVKADALNLPFADAAFDVVTISFGLRNTADPRRALREALRVTRPGGRLVITEFSRPVFGPFRRLYTVWLTHVVPAVARLASSNAAAYVYLAESISAWPDQAGLSAWIVEAGWAAPAVRNLTGGITAVHTAVKPAPPAAENK